MISRSLFRATSMVALAAIAMLQWACAWDSTQATTTEAEGMGEPSLAKAPACAGVPIGTTSLSIVPGGQFTIGLRETVDLDVVNQSNLRVPDCSLTWSSSRNKTASVNSAGQVTGSSLGGPVTITAQTSGRAALKVSVNVSVAAPVASITVSPATVTVLVGTTQTLSAILRDSTGSVLSGRVILWRSSDTTRATVSSNGIVTGNAAGSSTVTATSGASSGSSVMTIRADTPGLRMTLRGPAGTGFFITEVAGSNLPQSIWTLHTASGDSASALIDTPSGGPLIIRAYAIDQRTNPALTLGSWTRMLGATLSSVAVVPPDRKANIRLVATAVRVDGVVAPDSVDAFTPIPISWDVVDSSGLVATFANHHANYFYQEGGDLGIGPNRTDATSSTLVQPGRRRYTATFRPQDLPGLRNWRVVHWQETPRGILWLFSPFSLAGEQFRTIQVRPTKQALRVTMQGSDSIGTFFVRLTGGGLAAPVWRRISANASGTTELVQDLPVGSGFEVTVFAMDVRTNPDFISGGWSIVRGVAHLTGLTIVANDTTTVSMAPRPIKLDAISVPDTVRVGVPISVSWTLSDTTGAIASFANHHIGIDRALWPDAGIGPNRVDVNALTKLADGRYRYTAIIPSQNEPGRIAWKINHWQEVSPLEGGGILSVLSPSTVAMEAARYIVIVP